MNQTSRFDFTILVPLYNEKDNIPALFEKLGNYINGSGPLSKCVLIINDGSNDGGEKDIQMMCNQKENFYYLDLDHNCGLSGALKFGIDNCFSKYLGYIDADLQTDPQDFDKLLAEIENYELVTGVRAKRNDSFIKKASSKFANGFRRAMTHDGATDTGCPLKVMHSDIAKSIPFFKGMHRFIPALVLMVGGRYKEIPVNHFPRVAGKSKYHLWNRLIGPLADCFGYRWMKKRYTINSIAKSNLKDE